MLSEYLNFDLLTKSLLKKNNLEFYSFIESFFCSNESCSLIRNFTAF